MKVLLAHDIVYSYLVLKEKNSDCHLLIDLLNKMNVSIYVDPITNLALYYNGLIDNASSIIIRESLILPLLQQEQLSEYQKKDILRYAYLLDSPKTTTRFLVKDEHLDRVIKLFLRYNFYSEICYLKNRQVDLIISNDPLLQSYSYENGVNHFIYTTEQFFERAHIDYPNISLPVDFNIQECNFADLNLQQSFFNSFRAEYKDFNSWFINKTKQGSKAFVCQSNKRINAFLALKVEDKTEPYFDIKPQFLPAKRLKICSFKVAICGYRISERFLKIAYQVALKEDVDEIYITVFDRFENRRKLISILCNKWGFINWGKKNGEELVLMRSFKKQEKENLKYCYPFHRTPDSSLIISIDNKQCNLLCNGYIRQSYLLLVPHKTLAKGSVLLFKNKGTKKFLFAAVVEKVITFFDNKNDFISVCKKRLWYTEKDLSDIWDHHTIHPTLVKFLHTYDFKDSDIQQLSHNDFTKETINEIEISQKDFRALIKGTSYEKDIIIN